MPDDLELRRYVGLALRAVVVAFLAFLWVVSVWWFLAALGIAAGLAMLVVHPVAYLVLYPLVFLTYAFTNSREPILPGYWNRYPDMYLEFCWKSLKLGFPTMFHWVFDGF